MVEQANRGESMQNLVVKGADFPLTDNGELKNVSDWSPDVAVALAAVDGLTLLDSHFEVLNIMRDYYDQFNLAPIRKLLKKDIAEMLSELKANDDYLISLFPRGVMHQGLRVAGLPRAMLDAEIEPVTRIQAAVKPSDASHFVSEFEFSGKTYRVYAKGNLVDSSEWNEALAGYLANKESITLTDNHWAVLKFLRKFYFKYGITPMVKLLVKHLNRDANKRYSEDELYTLFPEGPSRQGARIAGLPEPQGCIDP